MAWRVSLTLEREPPPRPMRRGSARRSSPRVDGVTIELYFRSEFGADAPIELARAAPLYALVAEIGQ
jgi:hypothetical protein